MNQKVSIIIPCRNEKDYIAKCLDSICNSIYDKNLLKVFVCDGLSSDGTAEIIKHYEKKYSFVHYRENRNRTTPHALNLGIKESDADIDIILGAHAEIDKDFILNSVNTFQLDTQMGCVGGIIENVYENETSSAIGKAMSSRFGVGNAHFRTGSREGFVDTVAFGAYRKEVFAKAGYFDDELIRNQDDEFNFRLKKSGFKIYLKKNIISKYYVRASFEKLFKQYYQYGYWKVFVNKKHSTITTVRQLFPALFVLFILSGSVVFFLPSYFIDGYFLIVAMYIVMGLLFAMSAGSGVLETIKILFSFLILHTSYGIGYLEGILKFIVFNKKPKPSSANLSR